MTIDGLVGKPELNGQRAIVLGYNTTTITSRINVKTDDGEVLALKVSNLSQAADEVFPAAEMIQDPEMYPSYETDVVNVLDRLASLPAAAYDFDACESCLNRAAMWLSDLDDPQQHDLDPRPVLLALKRNDEAGGSRSDVFAIACVNLTFLLGSPAKAEALSQAERDLGINLLGLLSAGLRSYVESDELLSAAMMALRQLIASWMPPTAADDDQPAMDETTFAKLCEAKLLESITVMLKAHAPLREVDGGDGGGIELHEHAIAVFSLVAGRTPNARRAAALIGASAIEPVLGVITCLLPETDGYEDEMESESAVGVIRAATSLLYAIAAAAVGREALAASEAQVVVISAEEAFQDGCEGEPMGEEMAKLLVELNDLRERIDGCPEPMETELGIEERTAAVSVSGEREE